MEPIRSPNEVRSFSGPHTPSSRQSEAHPHAKRSTPRKLGPAYATMLTQIQANAMTDTQSQRITDHPTYLSPRSRSSKLTETNKTFWGSYFLGDIYFYGFRLWGHTASGCGPSICAQSGTRPPDPNNNHATNHSVCSSSSWSFPATSQKAGRCSGS